MERLIHVHYFQNSLEMSKSHLGIQKSRISKNQYLLGHQSNGQFSISQSSSEISDISKVNFLVAELNPELKCKKKKKKKKKYVLNIFFDIRGYCTILLFEISGGDSTFKFCHGSKNCCCCIVVLRPW